LRDHFLVHVSILYNFPLDRVARYTNLPARQPAYRAGRSHEDFLRNLNVPRVEVLAAVRSAWLEPGQPAATAPVPWERVQNLVATKFGDWTWVARF
jgi:lipoate-protein ligase A